MPDAISPSQYIDALLAWERGVAEWLGLNLSEVFALHHVVDGDCATVHWKSVAQQKPRWGSYRCGAEDDGENFYYLEQAHLGHVDAAALISVVGEKPRLMSREQELTLLGLAYEAERSR